MPVPFEVRYKRIGRKQRQERDVIGVILPTVLALRMGIAKPIFVSMGDIKVDWTEPTSESYRIVQDDA